MLHRLASLSCTAAALLLASTSPARAQWSTDTLSVARSHLAAASVGDLAFFGGGRTGAGNGTALATVDVYDASTGTWTTESLSAPRSVLAATSVGTKVLFAGGGGAPGISAIVDIRDTVTGQWTVEALSVPRWYLAATSLNGRAYFAGGISGPGTTNYDVVDVYDDATGIWTTATLSIPRYRIAAAAIGTKVFFAGGGLTSTTKTSRIDIYDDASGVWSTHELSLARSDMAATVVGSKVLFAGGISSHGNSDVVDVYDDATGTWTTDRLAAPRVWPSAATVGTQAVIAGLSVFDVYDDATGTWTSGPFTPTRIYMGATSVPGMAFFAGGAATSSATSAFDTIDVYTNLGERYCSPAVPTSTGVPAAILATGSAFLSANRLELHATSLPAFQFGYFLCSRQRDTIPFPGGSQGVLCIGNPAGRFAAQVQSSGAEGAFAIQVDLGALPLSPPVAAQVGEAWNFQAWFRDMNPGLTSNFTDAVRVTLR